jgi:hypothetical protein
MYHIFDGLIVKTAELIGNGRMNGFKGDGYPSDAVRRKIRVPNGRLDEWIFDDNSV